MFTLSIEHRITDLLTWKIAFDRYGEARKHAGVLAHRIRRPIDDEHHLVIELDFDTQAGAEAFHRFLTESVWSNPGASPALCGSATVRILEPVSASN